MRDALHTRYCVRLSLLLAEYLDKPIDKGASETTVYRRFAMLLDFLFADLDIDMKE